MDLVLKKKKLFDIFFIFSFLVAFLQAETLPKEFLLDKYKQELRQAIDAENYVLIGNLLEEMEEKIGSSTIKTTKGCSFCRGLKFWLDGESAKAEEAILVYIREKGKEGLFYQSALNLLIKIEQSRKLEKQDKALDKIIALKNRFKPMTTRAIQGINLILNNYKSSLKGTVPYIEEHIEYDEHHMRGSRLQESSVCYVHFHFESLFRTKTLGEGMFVNFRMNALSKAMGKKQVEFAVDGKTLLIGFGKQSDQQLDRYVLELHDGKGGHAKRSVNINPQVFKLYIESSSTLELLHKKLTEYDKLCERYQKEIQKTKQ